MTIGRLRSVRVPENERMPRAVPRIRVVVAVAVAAVIPFASGLSGGEQVALSALVLGYAGFSAVIDAVGRRYPRVPVRGPSAAAGIAALFGATLVLPGLALAALGLYLLSVTIYTCLGGRELGLVLAGVAIAAAALADRFAPAGEGVSAGTLAAFVALLPLLVLAADALTRRHRRTLARLAQLHDSLRVVTVTPDLQATLDSIARSAGAAVEAPATAIFLRQGGALEPAATMGPGRAWTDERVLGDASPLARAAARLERVVVPDVTDDHRFGEWIDTRGREMRATGVVGLAAVPIRLSGDVIGVLVAGFSRAEGASREEVALLATHADQAALVIVRAQAYERERRAAEELADADRRKGEFLGLVSHELRTPLTAVKGFVDTVLSHWDDLPDDRRRLLLTRASGNADDLNRLVGQLLDFTRIDADRVELRPQVLAVGDVAEAVVASLSSTVADHRVRIEVPPALAVTADENATKQVLTNLLTNAAKFASVGSRVTISARSADEEVVISVADEGPGVAPADRDRIFDRFYQASEAAALRPGTGIGLTIAKRFTELHGGRIWLERASGPGATFSFSLPGAAVTAGRPLSEATP
jgi:signal transduction histidine kinase